MVDPLQSIAQANPGFALNGLPGPKPGAGISRVELVRVQQAGGSLMEYAPSENVLWFEQLYRKLPPDGMFGALPEKPVTFTMGAFRVPQSMVLIVFDYSFDIYRFSGAAAGDFIPIEENRLSTQVGWDIKVDNNRPANLNFQIIPQVQVQTQQPFATIRAGVPPQAWQFDEIRATQGQGPAGPALSLMPQRRHRNGLVQLSNPYVAKSGSVLQVATSIINTIPIPIAFFEADIAGMLVPQHVYDAYQKAAIPVGTAAVNPVPGAT
jgi:hypothetical protein